MRVTFLGTGTSSGVPLLGCNCSVCKSADPKDNRTRSSVLIEEGEKRVVIDCGPDFRQQLMQSEITRIDGIVLTHEHHDHVAGIDEVRALNFINNWTAQFYCSQRVADAIKKAFHYIFENSGYPGIPRLALNIINEHAFMVEGIKFQPITVYHFNQPVTCYRIGCFTYITDANYISEEEKEKIKGSRVLVLNALRHEKHPSHFTLKEAIALAEEINAERTYFTHISHQLGLHEEVEKQLPRGMHLAFDGLKIEI